MLRSFVTAAATYVRSHRLGTLALASWFAVWTFLDCYWRFGPYLGSDTRIYVRAAANFIAGADPWDAAVGLFHFAGLPPTVQLFTPLTLLPENVTVAMGLAISAAAAIAIVRMLHLPAWWLLFPPLAQGVLVANPHLLLFALLLTGRPAAEAFASMLKIYAIVPVIGHFHWRGVTLTLAGLSISFVIAPSLWFGYAGELQAISARLTYEAAGGFSAAIEPILMIPMALLLIALSLIDRPAASWLAVPAMWPSSQFFNSTMAMPMARGWFAAMLAIPSRGVVPVAVALYIVARIRSARHQAIEPQFRLPVRRARRIEVEAAGSPTEAA